MPNWLKFILLILSPLIIFVAYFLVLRLWGSSGNIALQIDSIKQIEITASQITAILDDSYANDEVELSFTGTVQIEGHFYTETEDGEMKYKTPKLVLIPDDSDSKNRLRINNLNSLGRVVYDVSGLVCREGETYVYDSHMSYYRMEIDDYKVSLDSSGMKFAMHYKDVEETDQIEFQVSNCQVLIPTENELIPAINKFWIQEDTEFDEDFNEEWSETSFTIYCDSEEGLETGQAFFDYRVAPPRITEHDDLSHFRVFYPKSLSGTLTGNMEWKYGIASSDAYTLRNDKIVLGINTGQYKEEQSNAYTYVTTWIKERDGLPVFEVSEKHYPTMVLNPDANGNLRFKYDGEVSNALYNGYNLFPDLRSFLISNWMQALSFSIVMAVIGYFGGLLKKEDQKSK